MKTGSKIKQNNNADNGDLMIPTSKEEKDRLLAKLIKLYGDRVYSTAYKITHNHYDAEEVFQDVFLIVHKKIDTLKNIDAVSSWIHKITVNYANLRMRASKRNKNLLNKIGYTTEGTNAVQIEDDDNNVVDYLLDAEAKKIIKKAITELPPEYKKVIMLNDIGNLSLKKTSDMLNISIPALKSRLHRARQKLKSKLDCYFKENIK